MIRKLLGYTFSFILLSGLLSAALIYWHYRRTLQAPLMLPDSDIFTVERGDNINVIAKRLHEQGIIKASLPVIIYARLNGQASRLQAGDYRLHADTSVTDLLNDMANGKIASFTLTIVEGRTVAQLLTQLAEEPHLTQTLQHKSQREIAQLLGINGALEGQFLPDTYQFRYKESDIDFLKRTHQALKDHLHEAWTNRAPNLPLDDPYQALILASIIEKETGVPDERTQVAGVFIRRLQQGMRLQTDPTVIYGMGAKYRGTITRTDLQTDTPYNTYTREGLPPTPIALAGRASIDAALHPDDGKALYFVADGKGGHTFSDTYEAHQQAVAAYRSRNQ